MRFEFYWAIRSILKGAAAISCGYMTVLAVLNLDQKLLLLGIEASFVKFVGSGDRTEGGAVQHLV